jgi:hypothetical protein
MDSEKTMQVAVSSLKRGVPSGAYGLVESDGSGEVGNGQVHENNLWHGIPPRYAHLERASPRSADKSGPEIIARYGRSACAPDSPGPALKTVP